MIRNLNQFVKHKYKQLGQRGMHTNKVIAIRREDQSIWERRAPLSPNHVRKLVMKDGFKVLVQPSNRRAFPSPEYIQAGAVIQEDLSEASLILGVKQVPADLLIPNKTYAFFSHTIKAQEANMPLLDAILEKNILLIDYEKMVDSHGQRVVAFGKYAGVVGMIDIMHGLGLRFIALGHHTPFMHIGPAHNYRCSEMARQAVRDAGYEIALGLMPKSIGPLTFVFTGSGNVSQGAQEVFRELPYEYVHPSQLKKVAEHGATNKVYACKVSRKDHLINKETGKFDPQEYEEHPERYKSTFARDIAPYSSVIINGIYWAPNSPKLIRIPDAKKLLQPAHQPWLPSSPGCPSLPHRLVAMCDISADPGGSIEFMKECTTIDHPFCLYDAENHTNKESFGGNGVLVCSIDNMPTQLPREASEYFGDLLVPHIHEMAKCDALKEFGQQHIGHVVKNAVITANSKLTSNYEYIAALREKQRTQRVVASSSKKVLVLGAGYVSDPVIEYLSRDQNLSVTVVSALKKEADKIGSKYASANPVVLDVQRSEGELSKLIKNHDIVISLLPYVYHASIAEKCIKHKINMVTASYLSKEMKSLHDSAVGQGVTIVNEVGLDPGIDHMLAMQCFDEIKEYGGVVEKFHSYCGGLPAPESANNSLRYKFNWSPRAVLLNTISGARYLKNGKIIEIGANGALLEQGSRSVSFLPGFSLETFPNRDSIAYIDQYNIDTVNSILRGTLRYKGFSQNALGLIRLGLISLKDHTSLHTAGPDITWRQFMCDLLSIDRDTYYENVKSAIYDKLNHDADLTDAVEQLGLLSDDLVEKLGNPLDSLAKHLSVRLAYDEGERDIIIMHHEVGYKLSNGQNESKTIDFIHYGEINGQTAMAKTVGLPAAIAAKMVLEKEIQTTGMVLPLSKDIYKPILSRLQSEGLNWTETIKKF
ncbi:alpha-aminoadipic semialdehyde mitochondrial [Brachionus plicatilis]|uniref:Alpha-aminoadipic semialdehyde mitochondrial n=1 Tax=Brachionus plicatilis TaxID=10195 RepID=A0A3M7TAL2_BRAPC|nr:alpha-aminoadipic semialdehyde mitochondrial [Brachionus plicatilis]